MNEIALIGGAGFLGSRLIELFNKQNKHYRIYDIDLTNHRDKISYLDVEDLNSLDQLSEARTIINFAAVHRDDIRPLSRYDDVNVTGARNVCNAANKYNIDKIVFTSSVAVYGFAPPNTDESGDTNFFNDYGRTKLLAENIYKDWQKEEPESRTLVIVRPTVIFGEGNRGNVYNLLRQIASKRFVMIGGGQNNKSMAYVENVASFIDFSLSFRPGIHTYNYVDKPDINMKTLVSKTRKILFNKDNVGLRIPILIGLIIGFLADLVTKITGKSLSVSSIRVKKFLATTQFETSVSKTNFTRPVELDEGLERTLRYEFIDDNKNKKTFITE